LLRKQRTKCALARIAIRIQRWIEGRPDPFILVTLSPGRTGAGMRLPLALARRGSVVTKIGFFLTALGAVLLGPLSVQPGLAQRVFVAAQGTDSNPCTFALPCRTFQKAHDTVAAGGEINVLDPAGYGPLTIRKSINIQGHGFSGITVGSGAIGITISAGQFDKVTLHGLLIEGNGVGDRGIFAARVGYLIVENSVVNGFQYFGVDFSPFADAVEQSRTSETSLVMTNTVVSGVYNNNGGVGVSIQPSGSGKMRAALHQISASDNYYGILVNGMNLQSQSWPNLIVSVTDSLVASNQLGIYGTTTFSNHAIVHVMVTGSVVANNGRSFRAEGLSGGSTYVRIGRSTFSGNFLAGEVVGGGHILTFGDNYSDDAVVYPESVAKN
jgi:hypothetical protein